MKPIIYRITQTWIPNLKPGHHSVTVQIKPEADWPESGVLPSRFVSLQDYEALQRALNEILNYTTLGDHNPISATRIAEIARAALDQSGKGARR